MSETSGQSPPRRLRRALIALTVLVLAIGVVGVAVSYRLADIARPRLEELLTDVFGRSVSIGELSVSLLRRTLEVEDFTIGGLEGASPLLRVEHGTARVALRPLLRSAVKLRRVSLRGVDGALTLDADGGFEPVIIEAVATATEPTESADEGDPWTVHIHRGELYDARLGIRAPDADRPPLELALDRAAITGFEVVGGAVAISRVHLAAGARLRAAPDALRAPAPDAPTEPAKPGSAEEDEAAEPDTPVRVEVAAVDIDGLALDLALGSKEARATIDLHAEGFQLAGPFEVESEIALEPGGDVAAQGRLDLAGPSFAGTVRWSGLLPGSVLPWLEEASALPKATGSSSGILSVQLHAGPALSASGSVTLADVAIDDLSDEIPELSLPLTEIAIDALEAAPGEPLRVEIGSVRLERPAVSYSFPAVAVEAEALEEAPPTLPQLRVARIDIEDGLVRLRDARVEPPFETVLSQIAAQAREAVLPAATVRELQMDLRSTNSQRIEVSAELVDAGQKIDLAMDGVELTALRGYMAGTPLADVRGGTLTVRSEILLEAETVRADSEMILNDLVLGSILDPGLDDLLGVPLDAALVLLRDSDGSIEMNPSLVLERGKSNLVSIVRNTVILAFRGAINAPLTGVERLGLGVVSFASKGRAGVRSLRMVPGKTTLEANAVARVKRLGEILAKAPELTVVLRGRSSDADGSDPEARHDLAAARATEIRGILMGKHAVAPERITLADPIEGKPGVGVVFVKQR